ncbi:MAG: carbohydrate ABC transporter permease [Clostridiales bacterium]|jgi:multiple sugar transport system permease protein|nr:carbohydrate ABC transporter permease [Clostridiales bacterium]
MKNNEKDIHTSALSRKMATIIITTLLIAVGVLMIMPFVWMTVVSFERYANINPPFPPSFRIQKPSLFNFKIVSENGMMLKAYRNSLIIAVFSVIVNLISVLMGGYAFSKGTFKGKKIIFIIIMATMMIPFETRMIPMFSMFLKLNLTNTFIPLILPNIIDGFGLMLSKQFFDELPDCLAEAASIDGAGPFRTFLKVFVPLTTPIVATIIILKFMDSWNSFLWPLVILTGEDKRTVPILISAFSYEGGTRMAGSTMCVAFLGIIPVLIVFLFLQKYIIQSIALSGIKE